MAVWAAYEGMVSRGEYVWLKEQTSLGRGTGLKAMKMSDVYRPVDWKGAPFLLYRRFFMQRGSAGGSGQAE